MTRYHLMIKPCGPDCNIACTYCFYRSKDRMYSPGAHRMSDRTLERFVQQYLGSQDGGTVTFAWQGGEPTLMGLDFFQRVIELQGQYRRRDQVIENTIQTNGTLLDHKWCRFFHEHKFLVGLSVDGPAALHDLYRQDRNGGATSEKVLRASRLLRDYKVEFNTLTVVNRDNARHPLQVYRYLRNVIGSRYVQFIPCVEPADFEIRPPTELKLPTDRDDLPGDPGTRALVTEWSVDPDDFGSFMTAVFDEWLRTDVGRVFVINFEVALAAWMGLTSPMCTTAKTCGRALAIEHDGTVYPCDHYVYPELRLGSIEETDLEVLASSEQQRRFGEAKAASLPRYCRECSALFACWGECPKNRFQMTSDGERGLNYLCRGLRRFYEHADPWLSYMGNEIRSGRDAASVMRLARDGRKPQAGLLDRPRN